MKITPLEIRQKNFEKNFRGYNQEEVNAFLQTLSQEWERLVDEGKELRIKLESSEREVLKLREVENSLFKTLKTAEDTGANVIEQARHSAELILRESQLKADAMLNEAKVKAHNTIEESETSAKQSLAEMEDRLKEMLENYRKLESTRDELLMELKRISQDSIERVERIKASQRNFDAELHVKQARKEIKRTIFPNNELSNLVVPPPVIVQPTPAPQPVAKAVVEQAPPAINEQPVFVGQEAKPVMKSFFDEIG
jgi:cell division initiation protein